MKAAKWISISAVLATTATLVSAVPSTLASGSQGLPGTGSSPSATLERLVFLNLQGKSFRYNISGYISAPDGSQASVFGSGEFDTSSKSVRVSGTYGIPPKGYGIVTSPNFPGPKSSFRLIETLQAEFIGGKLFAYLYPKWATWASIDYARLSRAASSAANSVPSMEDNIYPMLEILMLPGPGVVVTRSTSGTLDGSKLSYYKVAIRPAALVRRVDTSHLPVAERIRITSVLGWHSLTCYIGFDKRGHLRQVDDIASTSIGNVPIKLDMVENTSKWAHPTSIVVPPASVVYDRTQTVNRGEARLNPGTIQAT